MPIYSPTGFLDVTNATLRGSKIVTTSNVGVANLNPLNTLSVGSNLQVEDTGSNVLTVRGNAAAAAMTLGVITIAPSYSLEIVSNIGNTVSNTVQFTNDTTGFVTTANIEVGTGNLFVDTTTGEVTVGEQLTVTNRADVTDLHASNLTVASALYANAASGRVGVNTTNPGNFALDVHGSANVGALTANSLIVTGNLAVAGEVTSIRTTTVTVDDPIIGLANNNTGGVLDTGFVIQRDDANVAIIFDESTDTLEIGYTQGKHTDTTITMDDSSLFHTNIHGNVSVSNLNIGQFSVVAAYGLDHVTNENNSTGDTIISTNGTTGLQTTADVVVGRDLQVTGDVTVDTSTFHVDSSTNRVGILTTSPGYDLDVHGSANVGTLTTGNVSVSSNLEVGTANLFVDTTTGNVGIGITDPGHNLDIVSEMNLRSVSNTASIKYNSNVVTEYVRSKKLIKYPRVKMTAATTSGYTASASNEHSRADNPDSGLAYDAFGNLPPFEGGWRAVTSSSVYSSGDYIGSVQVTDVNGVTYSGEWLQIEMPKPINVKHIRIAPRTEPSYAHVDRAPTKFTILASNDGTSWYNILHRDNETYSNSNTWKLIEVNHSLYYDTFRIVVHSIGSTGDHAEISKLEYYGIPEYDPEAHGTDVIARSVPNVPNTDWLEVYYDAKGLSDGSISTVDDLTPGGSNDGTATNLTVSDEAFIFNGTSSHLAKNSMSIPGGNNPFTFSFWVKYNKTSGNQYIFRLGETSTAYETVGMYINSSGQFVFASWTLDFPLNHTFQEQSRWYHVSLVYPSRGWSQSSLVAYVDGQSTTFGTNLSSGGTGGNDLNLATSANFMIGSFNNASDYLNGSIANFRLFNRALTADEIWQLYAYQKEYFQVSPDVVTFKGGRLGIGTSEPQAVLDVKGDILVENASILHFFDTPLINEWTFSGSDGLTHRLTYSVPDGTKAVLADVFISKHTTDDHINHVLGRKHTDGQQNWTDGNQQPSVYFGDMYRHVVNLTMPGETDGFSHHFGKWFSSQIIPIDNDKSIYQSSRGGSSSTTCYFYVITRGYYR